MSASMLRPLAAMALSVLVAACSGGSGAGTAAALGDAPEVVLGERLFLDTRFAQFYAAHAPGDVNAPLASGDPAVATLPGTTGELPGPFRGQSMNCRQCHLVDEAFGVAGGGTRTYADFARRSRLTERGDGASLSVRNSPALVGAAAPRATDFVLHFDGEFASTAELARAGLTGRMLGWLPEERDAAVAHVARVLREDDGRGALAAEAGGAYRSVLSGTSAGLVLPAAYRIDVTRAGDDELVDAAAKLIAAYLESLGFARNAQGVDVGSPYDLFLARNGLPATPAFGESDLDYARRLRSALDGLAQPDYVPPDLLRRFQFHAQPFQFGAAELRGLRVFLAEPAAGAARGVGNCVACHAPPQFTDYGLHNTGIAQFEYDGVHGDGAFAALPVPTLAERAQPDVAQASLPATTAHPHYAGRLRAIPDAADARRADLGAWNIYANDDYPRAQAPLRGLLCNIVPGTDCTTVDAATLLTRAVATFKTPSLRDLGDSAPYMHDGGFDTLDDAVAVYSRNSAMARAGTLRNADPRLAVIALDAQDRADLAAFLRALDEDYN